MLVLKKAQDLNWSDLPHIESPLMAKRTVQSNHGTRYGGETIHNANEHGLPNNRSKAFDAYGAINDKLDNGQVFLINNRTQMPVIARLEITPDNQAKWELNNGQNLMFLNAIDAALHRVNVPSQYAVVRNEPAQVAEQPTQDKPKPKKLLTIAKIARKLRQIEGGSRYEEACFYASKIGWEGICGLVEIGHPENDPNLMPSRYMILPGATDENLVKKGNLNRFPYPIHKDAPTEFSVFNLKRFLSATGHLNDDRPFWHSVERRTDTELQGLQSDNFLQSTDITEKSGRAEFDSDTERALNQYLSSVNHADPKAGTHTVKAGETLSSIAKDYGYPNWQVLWHDNRHGIKNPDLILEGAEIDLPDLVNDELEPWFHEFDNGQQVWSGASHYRFPANYFSLSLLDKTKKPIDSIKNGVFEAYRLEPNQLFYSLRVSTFDQISVLMPDCDNLRVHTPGFNILNLKDNQQDIQQYLSASSGSGATDTLQTSSISNSMATNTGAYLQADYSEDE